VSRIELASIGPRNALSNGIRITGADASFYLHEVTEATKMSQGGWRRVLTLKELLGLGAVRE
jgi:hypothetical protein